MFSSPVHWALETPGHTRAAGDGGLLCWGAHLPKCLSFPIYKMVYWCSQLDLWKLREKTDYQGCWAEKSGSDEEEDQGYSTSIM